MKLSRIAALILAVVLLCCAAFAEALPAENVPAEVSHSLEILVGGTQFTFPMSIAQAKEAGMLFDDEAAIYTDEKVANGKYFRAGNGRSPFSALVMPLPEAAAGQNYNENNLYVAGLSVEAGIPQSAVLAGSLTLGESSLKDCVAVLGEPRTVSGDNSYAIFRLSRSYTIINLSFEDNVLSEIDAYTTLGDFGLEFSPAEPDSELPNYSAMSFNSLIINGKYYAQKPTLEQLEKDGWRLNYKTAATVLEPQTNKILKTGVETCLYNGEDLLCVFIYNPSESDSCSLTEGEIIRFSANVTDGASLILADGRTFGSTLADLTATYGEPTNVSEEEGYTTYEFRNLSGGAFTSFNVQDDEVIYVRIQP